MRTVAVLLIATQLFAAAPVRTWLMATLTETHREEREENGKKVIPVQFYTLEVGDRIIICSHPVSLMKGQRIDLEVGAKVNYSRASSSSIIVQDSKGKEHKLAIEQETMKAPRQ